MPEPQLSLASSCLFRNIIDFHVRIRVLILICWVIARINELVWVGNGNTFLFKDHAINKQLWCLVSESLDTFTSICPEFFYYFRINTLELFIVCTFKVEQLNQ